MKGQKGNFVILMLFSCLGFLALAGIVFYVTGGKNNQNHKGEFDPKTFFEEYKARLEYSINNPQIFKISINRNANQFGCLFSVSGGCKGQGGSFLLFESKEGNEYPLSQIVKSTGLNTEGALCNGFPSKDCPIRAEAEWQPVCGGAACEVTKSMNIKVSLRYDTGEASQVPLAWNKTAFLTPEITLTASVQCTRQGGIFDGGRCLTGAEAQRLPASNRNAAPQISPPLVNAENGQQAQVTNNYVCPDRIMMQGVEQIPYIDPVGKARIETPASNGCPNAYDVFMFQCTPTVDSLRDNTSEGQWVQTEAVLAPACDDRGMPYDTSQAPVEVR